MTHDPLPDSLCLLPITYHLMIHKAIYTPYHKKEFFVKQLNDDGMRHEYGASQDVIPVLKSTYCWLVGNPSYK